MKRRVQFEIGRVGEIAKCQLRDRRHRREGPTGIDERIRYPCYRSLDDLVDVDRLRSLDGFLTDRIRALLGSRYSGKFYTGGFKRGFWSRSLPGVLQIVLTERVGPPTYFDVDDPDAWKLAPIAEEFGPLMDFVRTLPLARTARIIIIADARGRAVTPHRDHDRTDLCHEFVWLRTNENKRLWFEDIASTRRVYVDSHSAWFDTVNQVHGCDGVDGLAFSIRVDGRFTPELRSRIPETPHNPASRSALWAAVDGWPSGS